MIEDIVQEDWLPAKKAGLYHVVRFDDGMSHVIEYVPPASWAIHASDSVPDLNAYCTISDWFVNNHMISGDILAGDFTDKEEAISYLRLIISMETS